MLLALSIVKCLDKTRKYTERNKKKYLLSFFFLCLICGWIRSNGKRPMDVVSFLARGSEIMSYENSAVYFVNLASVSKY